MQISLNLLNCSADTVKRDHKLYENINKYSCEIEKKESQNEKRKLRSVYIFVVCVTVCVYGCVRKLCVNASERVCACECGLDVCECVQNKQHKRKERWPRRDHGDSSSSRRSRSRSLCRSRRILLTYLLRN